MASFLRELRKAYPNMGIGDFVKIYEESHESDDLLEKLDESEKVATLKKEEGERQMCELRARLSASELHHALRFVVPSAVDLEHAQAVLMHGFLVPGQGGMYVGSRVLRERNIRENVEHKLGFRFSREKYQTALEYFRKLGMLNSETSSGRDEALSLKSSPTERGVVGHGVQILRVALEFARSKKKR
ncbi:MAG: hypothetical protein Q8P21_00090 [bacterium]|nr:hypothetical protein [bacterium]